MTDNTMSASDEKNWALFTHLATFSGFIIPLGSILGPLVIWLMKKNDSSFVDQHGKAAVNFQISLLIWIIICIPLCFILIGFVLIGILAILHIVCAIINMVRASNGEPAGYPLSIKFVS